ncbi:MAG: class I SAM-dependent methyltransferase [Gemmatimonadota bacterium]|nr:class I SAM-dependent methyltransferase [Gemmatimonadota bacterium]
MSSDSRSREDLQLESVDRTAPASTISDEQRQTESTFGFKWAKRDTYESEAMRNTAREWLFERYCGGDPQLLADWLSGGRKKILDAGCGAGFSAMLFFGDHLRSHDYIGADISDAAYVAQERFKEAGYPGTFIKRDLLDLPIEDGSVDMIFSEGVLHHTDSTERALKALAPKLRQGGRFLFYVYAKKAVIREFTDDAIRDRLRLLSDEDAWKALEPLTKLGIALGELGIELTVPEDIPYLGIKAGKLDIQRFFYWNICKVFYRHQLTLDEMNHINFDWFRPLNCHRQTPEQVSSWCREAHLQIERSDVQEAGITVVARREL